MGNSASQLDSFVQGQPKKLYSGSVSGLAELDFTNFPLDAKVIIFQFTNLQLANNSKNLEMRMSTDNGLNYDNGGSAYSYAKRYVFTASSGYLTNAGTNVIRLDGSALASAANRKQHYTIMVFDPFDPKMTKVLAGTTGIDSTGRSLLSFGGHCYENESIVNAIRIFVSGTTFTDGEYAVYTI